MFSSSHLSSKKIASNSIDFLPFDSSVLPSLDRTNVAQFSAGVTALAQQLVVMGIQTTTELDPTSQVVHVLMDMYSEIGDYIALQYGGSEAHKKVSLRTF